MGVPVALSDGMRMRHYEVFPSIFYKLYLRVKSGWSCVGIPLVLIAAGGSILTSLLFCIINILFFSFFKLRRYKRLQDISLIENVHLVWSRYILVVLCKELEK